MYFVFWVDSTREEISWESLNCVLGFLNRDVQLFSRIEYFLNQTECLAQQWSATHTKCKKLKNTECYKFSQKTATDSQIERIEKLQEQLGSGGAVLNIANDFKGQ